MQVQIDIGDAWTRFARPGVGVYEDMNHDYGDDEADEVRTDTAHAMLAFLGLGLVEMEMEESSGEEWSDDDVFMGRVY